jgi:predicted dehydrogenase
MKKIKIGIIGAGKIVSNLHLPILSQIESVHLEYIADIQTPNRLAKLYGTCAVEINNDLSKLPNCDLVLLATPVGVREDYILEFSKRKIPIYSEKPFAPDLKTHENWLMLEGVLLCNYMRRMYSNTNQMKQILESNIFGKLLKVVLKEGGIVGGTNKAQNHYQNDANLSGGGILVERGSHTFSQIDYWFGESNIQCIKSNVVMQEDLDVDVKAIFNVLDSKIFELEYHISLVEPIPNLIQFYFKNTIISFDHTDAGSQLKIQPSMGKGNTFYIDYNMNFARTIKQGHYLNLKDVFKKIKATNKIDIKKETSIYTTRLINDIYKKAGVKV